MSVWFKFIGAAQCLGELYRHFGRRITSGLLETTIIATKLIKFHEVNSFNMHFYLYNLSTLSLKIYAKIPEK